jgi:hypothetical protein
MYLYSHSSLKVGDEIDDAFTHHFVAYQGLLKDLGVEVSIRHITEFNDPASLVTKGTFLGKRLQLATKNEVSVGHRLPITVSLGVFEGLSDHKQLKEASLHTRRIENLKEGSDYRFLSDYALIIDYDEYAKHHKILGKTAENWRELGVSLRLANLSEVLWKGVRMHRGSHQHIPKTFANHKLVVSYDPKQEKDFHVFIPNQLQPNRDRLIYKATSLV